MIFLNTSSIYQPDTIVLDVPNIVFSMLNNLFIQILQQRMTQMASVDAKFTLSVFSNHLVYPACQ